MSYHTLKTGSCSIILGKGHFKNYMPEFGDKLVKVTKIIPNHNEFTYLPIVRSIDNYSEYYSIPDERNYLIQPSDNFYKHIINLCSYEDINIFGETLSCVYIDFAGDKELLDTIGDLDQRYDFSFWKSYSKILKFSKEIMTGLKFLHEKKLCHLDIKPENIIVNTRKSTFKIIDFGFCSKEPFTDYIDNIRGTIGYFPKYVPNDNITPWLPKIIANDCIHYFGELPMKKNYLLVYKIDSYCFGRVLNFLKYAYDENVVYLCYNYEVNKGKKLDSLINDLLESNCWKRKTIKECLYEYFNI